MGDNGEYGTMLGLGLGIRAIANEQQYHGYVQAYVAQGKTLAEAQGLATQATGYDPTKGDRSYRLAKWVLLSIPIGFLLLLDGSWLADPAHRPIAAAVNGVVIYWLVTRWRRRHPRRPSRPRDVPLTTAIDRYRRP